MYICSDPQNAIQCIDSNARWSIQLPFCNPPVVPYCYSNVECDDRIPCNNTTGLYCDVNKYTSSNLFGSSLFGDSRLRQRIRQKIDSRQIPSSDAADSIFQHSTDVDKKDTSDFMFDETVDTDRQDQSKHRDQLDSDIEEDDLSISDSEQLKSGSHSLTRQFFNADAKSKPSLSKHSSINSIQLSTIENQTIGSSNQLSPLPSTYVSSKLNENNLEKVDRDSRKKLQQEIHNVIKSTSSKHDDLLGNTATSNIGTSHLNTDRLMSTMNIKRKPPISAINSPTSSTRNIKQQNLRTPPSMLTNLPRSASVHNQYKNRTPYVLPEKLSKDSNWVRKFKEKLTRQQLNTESSRKEPSKPMSPIHVNETKKFNVDDLHMREALTALKPHLTKEAIQALINKKKDLQQNAFMRILTGPSKCCRSCRTQRRLAAITQDSIDIAIKDLPISIIDSNI